jgi:hypothetical protein
VSTESSDDEDEPTNEHNQEDQLEESDNQIDSGSKPVIGGQIIS